MHFSLPAGHLLFEVRFRSRWSISARQRPTGRQDAAQARPHRRDRARRTGGRSRLAVGHAAQRHGCCIAGQRAAADTECGAGRVAAQSTNFSLALARLCARRLRHSNRQEYRPKRAHIFALVPNSMELDVADLATRLVDELSHAGRTELVWDARATTHTATWFNRIEEVNDFVVYVANWAASGWTRQCCRQADVILMAAPVGGPVMPWPAGIVEPALARGARVELALVHQGGIEPGSSAPWLKSLPRHAAPSYRRTRRRRQSRPPADAPWRGIGAVGRRRARFCALGHHSRAARGQGPDRFSRWRQYRRHHRRRRGDGLERRRDAAALSPKLRPYQSGQRLHLSVSRPDPRQESVAAAGTRVWRCTASRICVSPISA